MFLQHGKPETGCLGWVRIGFNARYQDIIYRKKRKMVHGEVDLGSLPKDAQSICERNKDGRIKVETRLGWFTS